MTYALALTAAASLALGLAAALVGRALHRHAQRWSHREFREWSALGGAADLVGFALITISGICCISLTTITLLEGP